MILAVGEALMEFRRETDDGRLAAPGDWAGPFPSGAPAIFASVAARLGAPTAFAGAVGDDRFGRAFRARLERDGLDVEALALVPHRATGLAFVAYAPGGGRDFWFSVPDSAAMEPDRAAIERLWPRVDWLHVSGSTLGFGGPLADAAEASAEAVAAAGGRISLDPNLRPDAHPDARARLRRLAQHAHVLFPSAGELDGLDEPALLARGALICHTRGASGAIVQGAGHPDPVHVPAPPAREVDPTGAGDTFAAAFVSALRGGADAVTAAERACATAARSVEFLGAMEAPVQHRHS